MQPRSAAPAASRIERRVRVGLVLLVLAVGATSAAIAWQQEADAVRQEEIASLQRARDLLEGFGRQIEASLAGSAGLVRVDGALNLGAFDRYATELADAADLTALALERVVSAAARPEFEVEIDGPIIDRGPGGATPAPDRPVHYAVRAVAPTTSTSEALIGYDLQGEPVRRAAAERARDTGAVVVSEPVPAEPTGAVSFFVIKALYEPGDVSTEAARRQGLVGFISTAYPGTRLAEILRANLPGSDRFEVRDGAVPLAATASAPSDRDRAQAQVADRTWTVLVDSGATPDHTVSWLLVLVTLLLGGGLAETFRRTAAHNRVLDDAARRAALLAALAQRLNSAETIDAVVEVVTTLGREPVEAAATSIGVIDGGTLDVRHGDTVPEAYRIGRRSIALDAPLGFAEAARTGDTLLFDDQAAYEARFPDAGGPVAGARSFHPIRRTDGATIGAIAHLWTGHQQFDDALVSTLSTIADLTGQSIERARLAEATARDAHTAVELARLAQGLASRTSSDDVTRFLTEAVLAPLGAVHAAVAVIDGGRLRRDFTPSPLTDLLRDLLPGSVPLDDDSPLAEAARTGEVVLLAGEHDLRARYPHLAEGWIGLGFQATANLPLRDRSGQLIGALGVAWDHPIQPAKQLDLLSTVAGIAGQTLDRAQLVDRVRSQARRSGALAALAEVLATARSASEVALAVTRQAAAVVDASRANLAVLDPATGELVIHHPDGTDEGIRARYDRLGPDAPVPHVDAVREGRAIAFGSRAAFGARYPHLVADLETAGAEATAVAPLRDSGDRFVGAVGFVWERTIPDEDLPLTDLRNVADLCAQALERAQLADAEHRLVMTLQSSVLTPLPELPGLRVTARYMPAARTIGMGGDWYEGLVRSDDRYLVIVGDVAGHGVTAVGHMAQLRSSIGAVARLGTPVEHILPLVSAPGHAEDFSVATAALVEIEPARHLLRYCCAGHPPPLVRDPAGRVSVLDGGRQPLLGLPMSPAAPAEAPFPEGSVLICYTDGLIERRDETIDGSIDRLVAFIEGIRSNDVDDIADAIIERWRREESQVDDVALAVIANVGAAATPAAP